MTVQSVRFLTNRTSAGISDTIRPRLLTINRKPVFASAGWRINDTGAPLWTPVPLSSISRAMVVCRAPMVRFDICGAPRSQASVAQQRSGVAHSRPVAAFARLLPRRVAQGRALGGVRAVRLSGLRARDAAGTLRGGLRAARHPNCARRDPRARRERAARQHALGAPPEQRTAAARTHPRRRSRARVLVCAADRFRALRCQRARARAAPSRDGASARVRRAGLPHARERPARSRRVPNTWGRAASIRVVLSHGPRAAVLVDGALVHALRRRPLARSLAARTPRRCVTAGRASSSGSRSPSPTWRRASANCGGADSLGRTPKT